MELREEGSWILLARVTLDSSDTDPQNTTAKLIHDTNVLIHEEGFFLHFVTPIVAYFQVGFTSRGKETITLECNTYKGVGTHGSIVALKVDQIDYISHA